MERDIQRYYDQPLIGTEGVAGAGLIWYMSQDHLSPPASDEDEFALNAHKWREATSARVLSMGQRMMIEQDASVLDLGTGVGGPGRDFESRFGCRVFGLNISHVQLASLRRISAQRSAHYTDVAQGDMRSLPFRDAVFEHVISVNSLFHVSQPDRVIKEVARVLKPGGTLGIDDWFVNNQTSPASLRRLRLNWSTSDEGFHAIEGIRNDIQDAGLTIVDEADFSQEAGEFLTEDRFGHTFDTQVAPTLVQVFPNLYQYDGYRHEHAQQAASQLRADALYMGELYRGGQASYMQVIAQKD